ARHVERVDRTAVGAEHARRSAAVESHFPGRPMPGHSVFLIARDRVLAHAGEVIVGGVVLAHVSETEAPVLVLARAALRGAVRRLQVAVRPLADRSLAARTAFLLGLDPDAVDQW